MLSRLRPSTLGDGLKRYNWMFFAQRCLGAALPHASVCCLCRSQAQSYGLCRACEAELPWRKTQSQRTPNHVDELWACFEFSYPMRALIHRMKFGKDIACARLLGELMAQRLAALDYVCTNTCLYPVPLGRRRMWVRGFNQAVEIALPIGATLNLPIDTFAVHRLRVDRVQSTLSAEARRSNMRRAFKVRGEITHQTAIVVDDVVTTGATLSAVARNLKSAGVKRVVAWVLAAV